MDKEQFFSGAIRVVFLFAFGAFLSASLPHIATFFHNFEPDNTNWLSPYALAISIDATALILTIGVMFFRKNMPWQALALVWFFIISLTAFSWLVNWEYAMRFQSANLTTNPTLELINPILASSFAFLNLAYSLVSEFFSARVQTAEDMTKEAARLEALIVVQNRLDLAREQLRKPSIIQRAKDTVMEVKSAANEIISTPHIDPEITPNEDDIEVESSPEQKQYTARKRDDLGMIEGAMYDKVMEDKTFLPELLKQVNMTSISDVTLSLRSRFPDYANYISESRVRNVFEAIKFDNPDLISRQNTDDLEIDTDPEMETISPSNEAPNTNDMQDDINKNIISISRPNKTHITRDLSQDIAPKRGAYAITKEAASEMLRCPISEIERGISSGIIKPFAKSNDKVLVSSLEGFEPVKRTRKMAKVGAK